MAKPKTDRIDLPKPFPGDGITLEEALAARRSIREYTDEPLSRRDLSRLCWAAQGVTSRHGDRTAPSAGGLFPLELYVANAEGLFHYEPRPHRLARVSGTDPRPAIHRAALAQDSILQAPAVFVIAAVHERIERRYGRARTPRYVHMEVGHAAQNLLLEAVSLGLGGVPIGAFYDGQLHEALSLPPDHRPLYLVPVGRPRRS